MARKYNIDLHVHTCLSPCADLSMVPTAIINEAKKRGLDCIGICDHNSAENVEAVRKAGERAGVYVLGGMEITSCEEVHILGIFGNERTLQKMQELVYENLPGENDEMRFGEQLIVDDYDRIAGSCIRMLIGATNLSLEQTVQAIRDNDGIAIASHIDREQFSIIGQLGFIPDQLPLHALEISPRVDAGKIDAFERLGYPLVTFSDAHFVSDIGSSSTTVFSPTLSFSALTNALCGTKKER